MKTRERHFLVDFHLTAFTAHEAHIDEKKITCSAFEISLPPKDAIGNGTKLVQNADIIFLGV